MTLETLQTLGNKVASFNDGYQACLRDIANILDAEKKVEEAKNDTAPKA